MNIIYCDYDLIKRHIAEAVVMAGLPMSTDTDFVRPQILGLTEALLDPSMEMATDIKKRLNKAIDLGSAKAGSGHDCFLKGIVVTAVVSAPAYQWPQIQRYHFLDIISSQSKMHKITKMDIASQCNQEVDDVVIDNLNRHIDAYNRTQERIKDIRSRVLKDNWERECTEITLNALEQDLKDLFRLVINNAPQGLNLAAGIVTNYLQLKTMYAQRNSHKLEEWSLHFTNWVEKLPYFVALTR